jgi:RNA polymerase sigma-70 factor, ECF subfamily
MEQIEAVIPCEQPLPAVVRNSRSEVMQDLLSQRLPSFYRTAYRFLGNRADAEDAVQDALMAAYKHLGEFRGQSQMSTWITTIVINSARMQLRRRPRKLHVSLDERFGEDQEFSLSTQLADERATPEDDCRGAELKAQLIKLAGQLSPALRRIFQLRDLDGLSVREAANILDVPVGTVKARSSRARAKLKRLMCKAGAARASRPLAGSFAPVATPLRGRERNISKTFQCRMDNG